MFKQIVFFMLLLTTYHCYAGTGVTPAVAKAVAETYYHSNTNYPMAIGKISYTDKDVDGDTLYYIVNMDASGFVIVSGTNVTYPIIAISTNGNYEAIPGSGVADYLYNLRNHISKLYELKLVPQKDITSQWNNLSNGIPLTVDRSVSSVSPLITTTWNQSPYYNEYCPGGSVTGCVATAMAQIMKYWNTPTIGTGSYSYTDGSYGTLSANFGTTSYAWSFMPTALTSTSTSTQENAVATLMYQAGVSVSMQYSPSGSGASVLQSEDPGGPCAQYSYVNYFGYNSSTIQGLVQSGYTTTKWDSIINVELNNGRPIEYVGFGVDGGHTWVLDGYNTSGLYDMNWGWGGLDDGYFALNNLDPSGIPLGSSNAMLIGIEPATTTSCSEPTTLAANSITSTSAVLSWKGSGSPKSYNLNYQVSGASKWTTISGISSASYTLTGLTAGATYNIQVQQVCSGSSSSSFTGAISFTTTGAPISYCTSTGTSLSEYIKTVKFGSINNTVTNDGGYHDYTSLSTTIEAGTDYKLTVVPGFASTTYTEYWAVYIDYNHTGNFVLVREGKGAASISGSISVPTTSVTGSTRMRIIMHRGSYITNACGNITNGDVQDYTVVISKSSSDTSPLADSNDNISTMTDISGIAVNVYPNPASSTFNIKYLNDIDVKDITLVDPAGKVLLKSPVKLFTLDVTQYAQGWYLLLVTGTDGSVQRKMIMVAR